MRRRWGVSAATAASLLMLSIAGCTGGEETTAHEIPPAGVDQSSPAAKKVDPESALSSISPAIPFYEGASYRGDLSERDSVMFRNQYGPRSEVYTLATDDSFPQVYHYYVTYLAQFRGYEPPSPLPPQNRDWRVLEVHLNDAMKDPFIPGDTLAPNDRQVILQVAETEAEPRTIIRYIVTPDPIANSPSALVQ